MAFSNNLNVPTNSDPKSSTFDSFHRSVGSKADVWGSNSIWNGSSSNATSSNSTKRDKSRSRDLPWPSSISQSDDIEGKTGSGSLVESSVSEAEPQRSRPGPQWAALHTPSLSSNWQDINAQQTFAHKNRDHDRTGMEQLVANASSDINSLGSRPPTANLHSLTPVGSNNSIPYAPAHHRSGSGQPPFGVFTKFDRPVDPQPSPFDLAPGLRTDNPIAASRLDPRIFANSASIGHSVSLPASRDHSLPPTRLSSEKAMLNDFDQKRNTPWSIQNSSRTPSYASSVNADSEGSLNHTAEQIAAQLRQLSVHRKDPSGSFQRPPSARSNQAQPYSHSITSSPPGVLESTTSRGFGFPNGPEDMSRSLSSYQGGSRHDIPRQYDRFAGHGDLVGAGRVPQQNPNIFVSSSTTTLANTGSSRSSHSSNPQPQSPNWHTSPSSARSPTAAGPQMSLDSHEQQLLAGQLRIPYSALYDLYQTHGSLQCPPNSSYIGVPPFIMPPLNGAGYLPDHPASGAVQSTLLYEFKMNNKSKRYELRDIYDHIAEFSGDQQGSRFIQTKLETAKSDEKDRVFREIQPNLIPLMTDVFGNYVIQKFFEHGDQIHKKTLANTMRGHVLQLSMSMYGCRVVQKAIEHVLVDQLAMLIQELENHVMKCVKDQNGNHVIQKAIERCPAPMIAFIISAFQGQVHHLSIHSYGCRVIQRCLEKRDLPSKGMILSELMDSIPTMICDQFGNYVVQHIVAHHDGEAKGRVLAIVGRGLEGYSQHKFASNVVEKCLEKADDAWRRQVVFILTHTHQRMPDGESILTGLIKDQYGNYVIQKLLTTLSTDDYAVFLEHLRPAMAQAKRSGCGKQVLSIEKKMHRHPSSASYKTGDPLLSAVTPNTGSFDSASGGYSHSALPTPPSFGSSYNSAATTPPLTADTQSILSSGIPSVNGDATETIGAMNQKTSELPTEAEAYH